MYITSDADVVECLAEELKKPSLVHLVAEAKDKKKRPKEPMGQLLAGMDKLLGDVFSDALGSQCVLLKFTIYGLYFIPTTDQCTVIRCDVQLGEPTITRRGKTNLGVSDAVNRVFSQMEQMENS